jgi:hypothetical protein
MTDDNNDSKPDYEVGYKRPPQNTRFKKGQSGNSKGRPRGSQNMLTVLQKELNAPVSITENGVRKTISKRQAAAKQLVNKAASGNLPAAKLVLDQERLLAGELIPVAPEPQALSSSDELVLNNLRQRLLAMEKNDEPDTQ